MYTEKGEYTRAAVGIGIVIKNTYQTAIKYTLYKSSGILYVAIQLQEVILNIISLYVHNISKYKEDAEIQSSNAVNNELL